MNHPAEQLETIFSRLGLVAEEAAPDWTRLKRRDQAVLVRPDALHWTDAHGRSSVAFALLGARYSLDFFADQATPPVQAETPLRFRRTNLRRYQEVEPEHGNRLPRLVPSVTGSVFHHLTGQRPLSTPWVVEDLQLLALGEQGLSLQILTEEAFAEIEDDEETFWEKIRRALFYEAYKRRPQDLPRTDGPDLRLMESVEGLGATRAHLYPEFDYDLAQDGGLLSVPSMDSVILAPGTNEEHHRGLQIATDELFHQALFPLSRACLAIDTSGLSVCHPPLEPAALLPDDVPTIFARS